MRKCALPLAFLLVAASVFAQTAFVFDFTGDDSLSGELLGIGSGSARFKPAIAPSVTLEVPLAKIERIARAGVGSAPLRDDLDALALRDGSTLYGRFAGVEAGLVRFDVEAIGPVKLPFDLVASFTRAGAGAIERVGPADRFEVRSRSGSVLIGALSPEGSTTLLIAGPDVSSRLSLDAVASIHFPEPQAAAAPYPKGAIVVRVELANGAVLSGTGAEVKDGKVNFQLAGRQAVSIPLISTASLSFGEAGDVISSRQILAWSAFADLSAGGERDNTLEILREGLGASWKIVEVEETEPGADFRTKLNASRTLVIPETENWEADSEALALRMKPIFADYLARGGTIVACAPTGGAVEFLAASGLIDLIEESSVSDAEEIVFVGASAKLSKGVGSSFEALNATSYYSLGDKYPAEILAAYEDYGVAILRKVGRGRVIVLGMDYYEIKDGAARVLVNAVLAD